MRLQRFGLEIVNSKSENRKDGIIPVFISSSSIDPVVDNSLAPRSPTCHDSDEKAR